MFKYTTIRRLSFIKNMWGIMGLLLLFLNLKSVYATVAFDYGFAQIVACPGTPVQVTWTGNHNIQETTTSDCASADINAAVTGYQSSGTVVFSLDELSASHGTTRYFKCSNHCNVAAARFEVSCPAGCQENYYGTPGSCVLCPRGKYTTTTGNTDVSHCLDSYAPTSQFDWRAEIRNCGGPNGWDPATCPSGTPICRHNTAGITSGVGQPVFSPQVICSVYGISTTNIGYNAAAGAYEEQCMYNEPCALDWGFGSNVKNFKKMFQYAIRFNQQLLNWDTSSVTTMEFMFQQAWAFDQYIGDWDTRDVKKMGRMFEEAKVFNQNIGNWDTSSVTQMTSMFEKATTFNGDISSWDTSIVGDFSYMFNEASSFNGDLSSWDTSAATGFLQMFLDATVFDDDLSVHWDTTAATNVDQMFHNTAVSTGVYCWSTLDAGATGATNLYNNGATNDCPCIPQPCQNSGSCSNNPSGGYICDCTGTGFDGTNCENVHADCVGHACLNGAVCVPGGGSYTCSCAAGWEGTFCATDSDECAANSGLGNCLAVHSASCADSLTDTSIAQGEYECTCNTGYYNSPSSMNCETKEVCTATDEPTDDGTDGNFYCTAGGTITGFTAGCACTCSTGFSGAGCLGDPCSKSLDVAHDGSDGKFYCINGGTIGGISGACTCTGCNSGFFGTSCADTACSPDPCQNGGTCTDNGDTTYTCTCAAGYTGTNCETDIDECVAAPCQNGGTCVDGVNSYTCNCVAGYTGTNCETNIDDCPGNSCLNGATCVDGVNSYTCNCVAGYTGTNCETDIDECAAAPCQNSGTCVDGVNFYTCNCVAGYTGTNCETDINDCAAAPCQNSGTCVDGVNSYTCNCVAGYTGTNCETDIDDCAAAACQNAATCVDGVNSYTCNCVAGYTGTNCETDIDECVAAPCQNSGTCVDGVNSYTCNCVAGYTGTNCETNIDDCSLSRTSPVAWNQVGNGITGPSSIQFGSYVIMNYDGSVVAFGAPKAQSPSNPNFEGEGYVSVYKLHGTVWTQMGSNIYGDDGAFAGAVALSDDGLTVAVGAYLDGYNGGGCGYGCGNVRIYTYDGSSWNQIGQDLEGFSSEYLGHAVSLNANGDRIAIGAPHFSFNQKGRAVMYEYDGSTWVLLGFSTGFEMLGEANGDNFGFSIKMNSVGDRVIVGSYSNDDNGNSAGQVRVYAYSGGSWSQVGLDLNGQTANDWFGHDVCMSADGLTIAVGSHKRGTDSALSMEGTVQVFVDQGGTWTQRGTDVIGVLENHGGQQTTGQGFSLSLSDDGTRLAVGAPFFGSTNDDNDGYVKVYEFFDGDWAQLGLEISGASDVRLGHDVALSGDGLRVTVGTFSQNEVVVYDYQVCQNGASCVDGTESFTCLCKPGFGGTNCSLDVDRCNPDPCFNGGTCNDIGTGYTCTCLTGFEGTDCEIDINECNPCPASHPYLFWQHGYYCTSNVSAPLSELPACAMINSGVLPPQIHPNPVSNFWAPNQDINFFYHQDCVVDNKNLPSDIPCLNSGTCMESSINTSVAPGQYTCTCPEGISGIRCESDDVDDCVGHACVNGACVDGINAYTCNCVAGWEGTYCDQDVDDCYWTNYFGFCRNGGTCVDGLNTYTCDCVNGWGGILCEDDVDDCSGHSCQNSGTCVDGNQSYTCNCSTAPGWEGALCTDSSDDCEGHACVNDGVCVDGHNGYTCACTGGYEGTFCEHEINECDPDPCVNGTCTDLINDYRCACTGKYFGKNCNLLPKIVVETVEPWYDWTWVIYVPVVVLVVSFGIYGTKSFTVDEKLSRFWVEEGKKRKRHDDKKKGKLRYILTNP